MLLLSQEKNHNMVFVEKRSFTRIPATIDARFFYGNIFYSGTVLDISEKGMFIHTKMCFDKDSMFVVIIRESNDLLKVIAKVKRTSQKGGSCNGMGIELISPSVDFLRFLHKLKVTA